MSNTFFFKIRAVYEIMWKNIVESDRPQIRVWRMRIACWIPKATNALSEYLFCIAFPLQQWLHAVAYPGILFGGGGFSTNSVEDRENGDLGAVAL